MSVKIGLGKNGKNIPLKDVSVVRTSSIKSHMATVALTLGSDVTKAVVNNGFTQLSGTLLKDEAFERRLSEVQLSFDIVASRLPRLFGEKISHRKRYLSSVSSDMSMYGVPIYEMSLASAALGNSQDKKAFALLGAATAAEVIDRVIQESSSPTTLFDNLDDFFKNIPDALDLTRFPDNRFLIIGQHSRFRVLAQHHATALTDVAYSMLWDQSRSGNKDASGKVKFFNLPNPVDDKMSPGVSRDKILDLVALSSLFYAVSHLTLSQKTEKHNDSLGGNDYLSAWWNSKDIDAKLITNYLDKVDNALSGTVYAFEASHQFINNLKSELGKMKHVTYEHVSKASALIVPSTVAGLRSLQQALTTLSQLQLDDKEVFNLLGAKKDRMINAIGHLFDLAATLSAGNSINELSEKTFDELNDEHLAVIESYRNLLAALLGSTEESSRILVQNFLESTTFQNSWAGAIYRHAVTGRSSKAEDLNRRFSLFGNSGSGYSFKVPYAGFNLVVEKSPFDTGAAGSALDANVTILPQPTERNTDPNAIVHDPLFDRSILYAYHDAKDNEITDIVKKIVDLAAVVQSYMLYNKVNVPVGRQALFTKSLDTITKYQVINSFNDEDGLRSVSRNQNLTIGRSYTLSADARKAVYDIIGIIDGAITHVTKYLGSGVTKAASVNAAPLMDRLATLKQCLNANEFITNALGVPIDIRQEDQAYFGEFTSALSRVSQEMFSLPWQYHEPEMKDKTLTLTVSAGHNPQPFELINQYMTIFGHFQISNALRDASKRMRSVIDRFEITKRGEAVYLNQSFMPYARLWNEIADSNQWLAQDKQYIDSKNIAYYLESKLFDKIVGMNLKNMLIRGVDDAYLIGDVTVDDIIDDTTAKIKAPDLSVDRMLTNRIIDAYFLATKDPGKMLTLNPNGTIDIAKFLKLMRVGTNFHRYYVPADSILKTQFADIAQFLEVDSTVIKGLYSVVDLSDIKHYNFVDLEATTVYSTTHEGLLISALQRIGISPYDNLQGHVAFRALSYIKSRSNDSNFPFELKMQLKDVKADEEYNVLDLMQIKQSKISKNDTTLGSQMTVSFDFWKDVPVDLDSKLILNDVEVRSPLLCHAGSISQLGVMDRDSKVCVEGSISIPYGRLVDEHTARSLFISCVQELVKFL